MASKCLMHNDDTTAQKTSLATFFCKAIKEKVKGPQGQQSASRVRLPDIQRCQKARCFSFLSKHSQVHNNAKNAGISQISHFLSIQKRHMDEIEINFNHAESH